MNGNSVELLGNNARTKPEVYPGIPTPSSLRVIRILAGISLTRFLNRMDALKNWKKPVADGSSDPKTPRVATAPKRSRRLLAWIWSGFMLFGFIMLCATFVERLSHHVDPSAKGTPIKTETVPEAKVEESNRVGEKHKESEIKYENGRSWPNPEFERLMLGILGLVCLILALGLLLFTMCGNQDLGRVEWDLEWLFTMPISARPLFVAQAIPLVLVGFTGFLPMMTVLYCSCGFGFWGLLLGPTAAAYVGLLIGFLVVLADIWFHKRLAPASRKNVQAALGIIASICVFLYMLLVTSAGEWLFPYFGPIAEAVHEFAVWNPFSVPVMLCSLGSTSLSAGGVMLLYVTVIPWSCVELSARLVRHGLTSETGAYQGTHGKAGTDFRRSWSGGIVGKELLLLLRDQNFLSQTLVLPIILFVFNMAMVGNLWQNVTKDVHSAAAVSFGLGTYLLIMSSGRVLASEGNTIWLLYTFPQALHAMLIRKTWVWCGFALLYTSITMVVIGYFGLAVEPAFYIEWVAALVGVVIYAFILSGVGILGTESNESGPWRQRKELVYLNLILIGLFVSCLYAPDVWPKVVQSILCSALALAIWQRVQQQLPYSLDQSLTSPPRITLIDGLVAVLAFFSIQTTANGLIALAELALAQTMTLAFVTAGALVIVTYIVVLRQKKIPNLLDALRLKFPSGDRSGCLVREFAVAMAIGGGVGIIGTLYMLAIVQVESIRTVLQQMPLYGLSFGSSDFWWMIVLLVIAAPICEEFIFRSLVYLSLRTTFRAMPSIFISAAIFAIVHPQLSVAPVFLLGLATAWSLERSSFLGTSMVVHMVYNAIVIGMSRWIV